MVAKSACDHLTSSFSMSNGDLALGYNLEVFKGHPVHIAGVAAGAENCLLAYGLDGNEKKYRFGTCGAIIGKHFSDFQRFEGRRRGKSTACVRHKIERITRNPFAVWN